MCCSKKQIDDDFFKTRESTYRTNGTVGTDHNPGDIVVRSYSAPRLRCPGHCFRPNRASLLAFYFTVFIFCFFLVDAIFGMDGRYGTRKTTPSGFVIVSRTSLRLYEKKKVAEPELPIGIFSPSPCSVGRFSGR